MRQVSAACLALSLVAAAPAPAAAEDLVKFSHSIEIAAPADRVWSALTTPGGLRWIAPEAHVELGVGGAYELYFFPDNPDDRGMEGTRVLAFVPERMLVTDGELAGSWVVWELEPASAGTRVTITSSGTGAEWAQRAPYFDEAMPGVLRRLASHVEGGTP